MEKTNWTHELIKKEILSVMESLNLKRMPSNSEILNVRKKSDLSNAIRRSGGFYGWAERLGVPIKESETKTGDTYELLASSILISKGYLVRRMSVRHPYDLLVNDGIKVDVKVSRAYMLKGVSLVNTVGLSKEFATCDLYVVFLLDENGNLDRTMVIPGHEVKHKYLNIGKDSKYNKYIDRWDYFEKYRGLLEGLDD